MSEMKRRHYDIQAARIGYAKECMKEVLAFYRERHLSDLQKNLLSYCDVHTMCILDEDEAGEISADPIGLTLAHANTGSVRDIMFDDCPLPYDAALRVARAVGELQQELYDHARACRDE